MALSAKKKLCTCPECPHKDVRGEKVAQDASQFTANKRASDGLSSWCQTCMKRTTQNTRVQKSTINQDMVQRAQKVDAQNSILHRALRDLLALYQVDVQGDTSLGDELGDMALVRQITLAQVHEALGIPIPKGAGIS